MIHREYPLPTKLWRGKAEEAEEYFTCRCPKIIENGKDGLVHCVPIDCAKTQEERIDAFLQHIRIVNEQIAILQQRKRNLEGYLFGNER